MFPTEIGAKANKCTHWITFTVAVGVEAEVVGADLAVHQLTQASDQVAAVVLAIVGAVAEVNFWPSLLPLRHRVAHKTL